MHYTYFRLAGNLLLAEKADYVYLVTSSDFGYVAVVYPACVRNRARTRTSACDAQWSHAFFRETRT